MDKQKWINEGGVFYPIPGYATLYSNPGNGVFRIFEDAQAKRLGLEKIDETFSFDFKIYDLNCEDIFDKVLTTWFSDVFVNGKKNLGVIFNGLKGTGKTIAAKLLSNRIGLPVIIVSKPSSGLLELIQSLCFECVILIDEAEKSFEDDQEMLLKMIDGVYNNSRKLYLLTTNKLDVDENLIGRPGRIRYIKEFGNLSAESVIEIVDDLLVDKSLKEDILDVVDSLCISTVDILKTLIEEVNIHGAVSNSGLLNIPEAEYTTFVVIFEDLPSDRWDELRETIRKASAGCPFEQWLEKRNDSEGHSNRRCLEEMFNCDTEKIKFSTKEPRLTKGISVNGNIVITSEPDSEGFFTFRYKWSTIDGIGLVVQETSRPSLYKGKLH